MTVEYSLGEKVHFKWFKRVKNKLDYCAYCNKPIFITCFIGTGACCGNHYKELFGDVSFDSKPWLSL